MTDSNTDFAAIAVSAGSEWSPVQEGWTMAVLDSGLGYWVSPKQARNAMAGDMVVTCSRWPGRFVASQLVSIELKVISISLANLPGLLTRHDRLCLEQLEDTRREPIYFSSDSGQAGAFVRTISDDSIHPLVKRCRILELLFSILIPELVVVDPTITSGDARDRLKVWLSRRVESDFLTTNVTTLATELGCSVRHFSRIFAEEVGVTFRDHQMNIRLQKACELLADKNLKIIEVALRSGYEQLSLFNSLFKRRYGMTPSEWRRQDQKKNRGTRRSGRRSGMGGALAVILSAVPGILMGQSTNSSAATVATTPASTNRVVSRTFEIKKYDVEGVTLLPRATLETILGDFVGPKCTSDTVTEAIKAVLLAYRGRGYVTVSWDPHPKLLDGVVHLKIIEGILTNIRVTGNHWFSDANIRRALPDLHTNVVLNSKILQKELDQSNLNPDRQVYPVISPGVDPGTSSLELKVKDQIPLHGRFELNNQFTPGTPELRGNASAQYNSLWQREHSIGLQYGFALQEFKEGPNVSLLDRPQIANYSGYYRLPLSSEEPVQPAVEANPQRFGYNETTRQFTLPPAQGRTELTVYASRATTDTGVKLAPLDTVNPPPIGLYSQDSGQDLSTTEGIGFRISKPLPEWNAIHSTFSFGADLKNFQRVSYNTNNFLEQFSFLNPANLHLQTNSYPFVSAQPPRAAHVSYLPMSLRWDGSRKDSAGSWTAGAGLNVNFAGGPFSDHTDFANTTGSMHGSGTYTALQLVASREQRLPADWTLLVKADGQWANQPLVSNEQLGLGGWSGGRGYLEGERYGDTGWRMTLEPRTPMVDIGMVDGSMPLRIQGAFFMDYGRSYSLNPLSPIHLVTLLGTGFGLNAKVGTRFDFRVGTAWALRETTMTPNGTFRVYFAIAAQF